MIRETRYKAGNGLVMLLVIWILTLASAGVVVRAGQQGQPGLAVAAGIAVTVLLFANAGLFVVNPNEARVITLFGNYVGSVKEAGFWFANPFTVRKKLSLRLRNFETTKLKVNDADSNPIEIAAIVVWKVVETAEAAFEVDDYVHYVQTQSEAALRALATNYPYDAHTTGEKSLSTHTDEVSEMLKQALHDRFAKAGVEVIESRISHLAYSPEIASAMLRRQQAGAVIAARQKIVEGAVGMVEHALELLSEKRVVALDEERKAQMVSNLLVVLCSDHDAQPVVNAGSLYQ
jgi:regulator of protease activity HflC (stomatin/prohibitin superfamily)